MPVSPTTHRYHFKGFVDARPASVPEKKRGVDVHNKAIGWLFSKFGKAFKVKEEGQTIWLNANSARNYLDFNSKKCPDNAELKGKNIKKLPAKKLEITFISIIATLADSKPADDIRVTAAHASSAGSKKNTSTPPPRTEPRQPLDLPRQPTQNSPEFNEDVLRWVGYVTPPLPEPIQEPVEDSAFIIAETNQFALGAISACTPLSVAYLSFKKTDWTSQDLTQFLSQEAPKWQDEEHCLVSEALEKYPTVKMLDTMSMSITSDDVGIEVEGLDAISLVRGNAEIRNLFQGYIEPKKIYGGVFTGLGVSVALKALPEGRFEFFDPHGDNEITKSGNRAYIKKCQTVQEAVQYLLARFPEMSDIEDLQDDAHVMGLNFIPLTPVSN